jgi:CRISPR-associated protein Csx17
MNELLLEGCQPQPLASYLKALGVLRLVSEQVDPTCRGRWSPEGFVLHTVLEIDELESFFVDGYSPSPVVSPWNGGSGFGEKDNTEAINAIESSKVHRLETYRSVVAAVRALGAPLADKQEYLQLLRNSLPDDALGWLDTAAVLVDDGIRFPILLGTGGNDGRFDFSNNFMQRLGDVLSLKPAKKGFADAPLRWLRQALRASGEIQGLDAAIGQFDPGSAGGSNSAPQGKGKSLVNPWDFVLMIEGALLFTAAGVRKRGANKSEVSVPFTFAATGAGFASASKESGRGEVWAPLWTEPSTLRGVQTLFSDGRITWSGDAARSGLDALRGVATLQGDRRISGFVRYAIAERFGLSNVAVPVGRVLVAGTDRPDVAATASLDPWLSRLRRKGDLIPSGIESKLRQVDRALVLLASEVSNTGQANLLLDVMCGTAELEQLVARSTGLRADISPIRGLRSRDWVAAVQLLVDVFGAEARIAWSLASGRGLVGDGPTRLREYVLPIDNKSQWTAASFVEGFGSRPIQVVLAAVAARRETEADRQPKSRHHTGEDAESGLGCRVALPYARRVSLADATLFASGQLDPNLLERCVKAFLLLSFDTRQGGEGDDTKLSFSDQQGARPVISALVAAVLAHAGPGAPAIASPPGLCRQLITGSAAAITSLMTSIRKAGREPMFTARNRPDALAPSNSGSWLAAALLLTPHGTDDLLDRCGYRPIEEISSNETDESATHVDNAIPQSTSAPVL